MKPYTLPARRDGRWDEDAVPDQSDRTVVITGANTGIGFETARVLAARGARVVLACRNLDKAHAAEQRIVTETGSQRVEVVQVDLSDLDSVRRAAADLNARCNHIDILINNAAVLWPPFSVTGSDVELQFATNYLGHFALTGLVLDKLIRADQARVVCLGSGAHWWVRDLGLSDLSYHRGYRPMMAYGRSKAAVLLFMHELNRRLRAAGSSAVATAAHPGGSKTELISDEQIKPQHLVGRGGLRRAFQLTQVQSAEMGALPILRAATDPEVRRGEYYGPGVMGLLGHPRKARSSPFTRDVQLAKRLWTLSEELTEVTYGI